MYEFVNLRVVNNKLMINCSFCKNNPGIKTKLKKVIKIKTKKMEKQVINFSDKKPQLSFWWFIFFALVSNFFVWYVVYVVLYIENTYLYEMAFMIPLEMTFIFTVRTGDIRKAIKFYLVGGGVLLMPFLGFIAFVVFSGTILQALSFIFPFLLPAGIGMLIGKIIYEKSNMAGYDNFSKILIISLLLIFNSGILGWRVYELYHCQTPICYGAKAKLLHNPNVCAEIDKENKHDMDDVEMCPAGGSVYYGCYSSDTEVAKKTCYERNLFDGYASKNFHNVQQCDVIKNLDDREECYIWFAEKTVDKQICHKLISKKAKQNKCEKRVEQKEKAEINDRVYKFDNNTDDEKEEKFLTWCSTEISDANRIYCYKSIVEKTFCHPIDGQHAWKCNEQEYENMCNKLNPKNREYCIMSFAQRVDKIQVCDKYFNGNINLIKRCQKEFKLEKCGYFPLKKAEECIRMVEKSFGGSLSK